jgi:hypothetical protein
MNKALVIGCLLVLLLALTVRRGKEHPELGREPAVAVIPQMAEAGKAFKSAKLVHDLARSHPLNSRAVGQTAELLAALEVETDEDRRAAALERAVNSIAAADFPAVLDSFLPDNRPVAVEWRQLLVRRWAEGDAPAAGAWAASLPAGPASSTALAQVALAWADADLAGAGNWLQTLSAGEGRQSATLALAGEAARTEPATALALAAVLPPSPERDDLLIYAVSQWAGVDPAAAAAWTQSTSDAALRERLIGAVAVASAKQDGNTAANLAVQSLPGGAEQDRAIVAIVQRWAQTAPQTAAGWVAQFPETPVRASAMQNLIALWTAQDSVAAGSWLLQLPGSSSRSAGFATYSAALAERDRAAGR